MLSFFKSPKLTCWVGGIGVALALPVCAVESPQSENVQQVTTLPSSDASQKKEAMVGIGGNSVSKALTTQFGLAEGVGLTIFHVVPDSPADKAGLKAYDVMLSFAGEPVGSQLELKRLISKFNPGDEILVEYLHQGKKNQTKLILSVRPVRQYGVSGENPQAKSQGLGGMLSEVDRLRIEAQMRQHMLKLEQELKNQALLSLSLQEGGNAGVLPQRNSGMVVNSHSSITVSDQDGSVTMRRVDGKRKIIVKNAGGKVLFEGAYDSEQDKALIPKEVQARLKSLDLDALDKSGIRIKVLKNQVRSISQENMK